MTGIVAGSDGTSRTDGLLAYRLGSVLIGRLAYRLGSY
jgi:hypothetical protein